MRSKRGTAAVAVLLAVVMSMTFVLSGCTGFFGARVDAEGNDPYQTPNIRGVWNAGSINDKIGEYYDKLIASLKIANSNEANELVGKMRYSVENDEGQNVLRSWIEGSAGQKIMLPDIILNANECEVADHIPECVADYETLKYAMTVASFGVNVDIFNMDTALTAAQMADILVAWYESKTGKEIDYANVNSSVPEESSKKLLALVPDYQYSEELIYNSEATTTMFVDTLAPLMSELNYEIYGVYSGNAKLIDFVKYAELFLRMYSPEGINYDYNLELPEDGEQVPEGDVSAEPEENVKLNTDWDIMVSDTNLYNSVDSVKIQSEEAITRLDLAKNMLLVLKAGFDTDASSQKTVADTSDESAKVMLEYSIMPNFPKDSNLFTPNYEIRSREIPVLTANFTKHCFSSWNSEGSYHYYDNLTMNDVCSAFADIESFYQNYSYYALEEASESINNSPQNEWFMSSNESGEYAEKNVTVAAVNMALNWGGNKEHTVETLRNAYIEKTTDEWSTDRAIEVLGDFGVTAEEKEDITTDAVLDELRDGNIILARYSSTGKNDVQYMVIYGFKKNGNSVKFLLNDPTAKHDQPTYANGSTPGKDEVIEGELVLWLINEAGGDYTVVYAEGNGSTAEDVSATDE